MRPVPRHRRPSLALVALAVAAIALFVPLPAPAAPQNNLTPTLTCVDLGGDGSVTAHFGYINVWKNTVNVPAGNTGSGGGQNQFVPAPANRGQPSSFAAGTFTDVFTVTFTEPALEWRLSDLSGTYNSVTATSASIRCAPVPAAGLDTPWLVALAAIAFGVVPIVRRRRAGGAS